VLIDVQQVIPLPEAAEYQIQIREKEQRERQERVERTPLRAFWTNLLALGEGKTALHERMTPHQRDYMSTSAGVSGLTIGYVIARHNSRVELYIDRGDVTANKKIFDELLSHKDEIESVFGGPLSWQRLDTKRACRIAYEFSLGGYKDDEANWPPIQTEMIDALVRLEKALSPFVGTLARTR